MACSQTTPAAIPTPSFAGLGCRTAAYLIDLLIASAIVLAAGGAINWLRMFGFWTPPAGSLPPEMTWKELAIVPKLAVMIAYVVGFGPFYLALFEASSWQASVGKRLLNIYVTDTGGCRLTLARSLRRSLTKCFLNAFYVGAVSLVTIPVTAEKEAWHDHLAKTRVVHGRPASSGPMEQWRILSGFGIQLLWLVITFTAVFRTLQ